jgi:formate dehydrogenase maturation protein FdhE
MRCGTEWQYVTNRCPRCGNSDPEKMRHVHLDEDMKHSVLLCSNCNDYVRIVSTDDPAEVSLEVEDVVMSWMDQIIRDPNFSAG